MDTLKERINALAGMPVIDPATIVKGWYFNPENGGFYKFGLNLDFTADVSKMVEITDEEHRRLMEGQMGGGQRLVVRNGRPDLVDYDGITQEQSERIAKRIQTTRMGEATNHISTLQGAVDLGLATDAEKKELQAWQLYAIQIRRIDTTAPDIVWPEAPHA